jgi:chromosome segregation ATPase
MNEARFEANESSLHMQLEKYQAQCLHLQKETDIANEAAQEVWGRLESTDNLLQLLASRASESESLLSSLESVNVTEIRARSIAEQELVNARVRYESLQSDSLFAQQELGRITKELCDSENALQSSAVEIARCHNEIAERQSQVDIAQSKVVSLQQELAHSDRRCLDLFNEVTVTKAKLRAEQEARSSTESELVEVQNHLHKFSLLFASEIQCARQELGETRAALLLSGADAHKLQTEIASNHEKMLLYETNLSAAGGGLQRAQSELVSAKSFHRFAVDELNSQIEVMQRDALSAKNLAELNYQSGVRVIELEHQLNQALRTLRLTESLLQSSEAFRNGFV